MKIVASIEARMTSKRLPGKVLLNAASKPMLEHLVDRLRQANSIHTIVLATTTNKEDDVLVDFAKKIGIPHYRGSEDDVLSRVIGAATSVNADILVEITGDCPLIDPSIIEQSIHTFLTNNCDYLYTGITPSYPGGMDTQVYRLETLLASEKVAKDPLDREHVTRHIRQNPQLFRLLNLYAPPELYWPELQLTLDEPADYELIKNIMEYFAAKKITKFGLHQIINMLRDIHPEWVSKNSHVHRKGLNA